MTQEECRVALQRLVDDWKLEHPGKTPVFELGPGYPGVTLRVVEEVNSEDN